jgi:hypothetical protein
VDDLVDAGSLKVSPSPSSPPLHFAEWAFSLIPVSTLKIRNPYTFFVDLNVLIGTIRTQLISNAVAGGVGGWVRDIFTIAGDVMDEHGDEAANVFVVFLLILLPITLLHMLVWFIVTLIKHSLKK